MLNMSRRRDIILIFWGKGMSRKKMGRLKFGKKVLEELFKLLKTSSMAAIHQRVASSSCSLVVLILLPLLLLPIEIQMRKGRSLAPCGSGGGEGVP
ncbi:hypothetical protein ES332_D05G300500v1 [Gossypium tomentosum]|uniref:Uncharacterized protein n=1 Tax=Gossypium tomentosum TaxID=34277 RepID=A0A5D2L1Y1_GOSTO|nr:hypothetical protein ES332_D05G300500v1 [Gossypium tomentosum]